MATQVNGTSVIERFIALKNEQQIDWWDQIDADEKKEIEQGMSQADQGDFVPREQAMAKYQKWRSR